MPRIQDEVNAPPKNLQDQTPRFRVLNPLCNASFVFLCVGMCSSQGNHFGLVRQGTESATAEIVEIGRLMLMTC